MIENNGASSRNPEETETNNNKAIFSLLLGIFSILLVIVDITDPFNTSVTVCLILIYFSFPIAGLILGIIGLKSSNKTHAIIGIISSSIALLFFFVVGLMWAMIFL